MFSWRCPIDINGRGLVSISYLISRCSITAIRFVPEFGVNTNTDISPSLYCFIIGWLRAGKIHEGFVVEGAGYQAPSGLSRDTNHNSIDSATTPKYARPVFSYPLSLSHCSPLEIAFHASRAEVRGSWNVIICPVRLFSTRSRLDSRRIIDVAAFATTERQARGRDFFQYFLVEGESLLFLGEIELLF